MFIYLITCIDTGKYYVGQHSGSDLYKYLRTKYNSRHRWKNNHLLSAMRKYPINSFSIEPLCEVTDKAKLDTLERLWIILLDSRNTTIGMNIAAGGNVTNKGVIFDDNVREKLRISHLGQKGFWTGKKLSNIHCKKLSDSHKKFYSESNKIWCGYKKHFVEAYNFHKDKTRFRGTTGWCKECISEYARIRYARSKNKTSSSDNVLQS